MKKPSATLNTDPLLKIGEAAKILGVSIDSLRRWEKSGRISAVKTPAGTRFYSLKALRTINPDLEHTNQIVNLAPQPEPITTEELLREIKEEGKELVQIKSKYPTPKPSSLSSTFQPQSTIFNPPSSIVNSDSIGVKILLSHFFPVAVLALALPILLFAFLITPKIAQQFGLNIANDKKYDIKNNLSSVLAATAGSAFLEVNTDVQIAGSLWVSDLINDLKIEATPSANTLALSSGTTSLTVTKSAKLDQDVSTTSSPTFATPTVAGLNLSAAKDQLVFQSGGPSGTLTWTPSSVQVITLPNATGTVLLDSATQTITNKTISGSSNTITNIPNSALTNKKVTVTAGTNLTGGGDVELGSSVTLALKDSPSISGTLTVSGATTLSSTLAVTGATTLSSTLTAGASTLSSLSVSGTTTLTGAATLSSTLDVTGNVGVGGTATFSNPLIVNSQIKITGGSPGTNKVLTSDSNGLAIWTAVSGVGGISGSGTQYYLPKFDSSSSITNSLLYDDGTNIGIGTASPGSKFTVIGNVGIGTSAAGAALQVNGGGLFGWGTASVVGPSNGLAVSGNVGIGTTSPRMPLEVWGNGTNTATFLNGNVGIGTTAPIYPLEIASSTQYPVMINLKNTFDGGDSNLALYVDQGAGWIYHTNSKYPNNRQLVLSNDGYAKNLTIFSNGNVGIGTSAAGAGTSAAGAALQVNGGGLFGWGVTSVAGPANGLAVSGNVGVGTTTPLANLHVVGQCVAKGTRIRRRRRKNTSDGGDEGDSSEVDWEEEDIPVEDIRPGDEVLSLNDKSGQWEWHKVEKTMDMGIQQVFGIKTSGGKYIKTTNNHPYLVQIKPPKIISGVFEVDLSNRIENINKPTFIALANQEASYIIKLSAKTKQILKPLHQKKHISKFGFQIYAHLIRQMIKLSGFRINKLIIDHDYAGSEEEINAIIKQVYPELPVEFKSIGHGSPADRSAHTAGAKGVGINITIAAEEFLAWKAVPAGKAIKKETQFALKGATEATDHQGCLPGFPLHRVSSGDYHNPCKLSTHSINSGLIVSLPNLSMGETRWVKVGQLNHGDKIATVDGWEYITEINELDRVKTYDLQIEGTHNFLGNGIIAHNTYVSGNVGIGFTSPDRITQIASDIDITGSLSSLLGANGTQFAITGSTGTTLQKKLTLGLDTTNNYGVIQAGNTSGTAYNLALQPGGGNVGIGTTSPKQLLDVFGTGTVDSTHEIRVTGSGDVFPGLELRRISGSTKTDASWGVYVGSIGAFQIQDTEIPYNNVLQFEKGSINNLIYGVGGNLGIGGISTPVGLLDVNRKLNVLSNGNVGIGNTGPSQIFQVNADTSNPFVVTSGGNVGIGTTSPVFLLSMVSSTQYMTFINMKNTYGGGNSNLTLYVDQGAGWIYPNNKELILSHDGNAKVLIVKSGNVGIGATAAGAALQVNGGGLFGWGTAAVAGPASGLAVSGNVGVGTTTPLANLHVVGQCVTGDTKLRRRRRKSKIKNQKSKILGGWNPKDDFEDIRIDQIQAGDEILTLDESTGKLTVSKVNKLLNKNIQDTYILRTLGGKKIRTTIEHPYFVREAKTISGTFEADQSIRIEDLAKTSFVAVADKNTHKLILTIDADLKQALISFYRKANRQNLFGPVIWARLILTLIEKMQIVNSVILLDEEYPNYKNLISQIIEGERPDITVGFKNIGHKSPAHFAAYGGYIKRQPVQKITLEDIWPQKNDWSPEFTGSRGDVTPQDKSLTIRTSSSHFTAQLYGKKFDLSRAAWRKVSEINPGMEVLTVDGWEKIIALGKVGREQVFDIEVENTHNFVGNDIVAHNTLITGNVGIGTLLPTAILQVNPSSGVTPFVVTSSGNVGIGRTNPQYPFDLTYSSTGNGFRIQRDAGAGPADVLNIDFNGVLTYDPNGTLGSTVLNFGNNITASTTDFFVINPSTNNTGNIFNIQKASTSKFLINTDGNVGIGTTNPSAIFAVGTGATSNFTVTSTGNIGIGGTATFNNPAIFNGNVGIGTSIPVAPLTIKSTGNDDSTFALRIYNSSSTDLFHLRDNGYAVIGSGSYLSSIPLEVSNTPYTHGEARVQIGVLDTTAMAQGVGGGIAFMGKVNSSAYGFYGAIKGYKANATADDYSGQLHFQTRKNNESSKTRMVIDENGNVGIGTSAPTSPTSRLSILGGNVGIGTSAAGSSLAVNGNGVFGWGTALVAGPANGLGVSGNVGVGTTSPSQTLDVVGNARFRSVGSGTYANDLNLTADGTLTTLTSDITMKTNLEPITGALDKLMQLKSYKFNWIDNPNGPKDIGLVAQEVAQTLPEITFTNQTDGKMGINYSKFAPLLIAAIQEQQANIGNLTTLVTQLGSQLTGLSDKVTTNNVKTLSLDLGSGTIASTSAGLAINLTPGADFQISNDTNSALFNITASGNVGIGTSNPQATLDVKASGSGIIARFNSDNSTGCTLSDTGTISCTSDENLKKNIEDLNYGLGTLMELKPVSFNWNSQDDSSTKNLGFIAQEVENLIPNLVSTDPKTGLKLLNTIGLIPLLVKSIQEQQTAINDLIASNATTSAILSQFKIDSFGNVGIGSSASGFKIDKLILNASDASSSALSSNGSNLIYTDKDNAISNVLTTSALAYFDLNSKVASVESKGNALEERIKSLEDKLAQLATAQVAGVATESGQLSGLSSQSSATSSSVISQPVNRQQTNQILTTENRTPIINISTSSAQITPEATASALVATPSASVIPSRAPGGEEGSSASISTSSGKIASSSSTPRNDISKLDLTPPDILFATASAQVADLKVASDTTISGQLTAYEATIQETFKALGPTFLSQTTIAGSLTINGSMSINQNSINTIGILYIQNSPLAKAVDFLNGLVKIDDSGTVWVQKLAVSKKTLGTDIIPAGQTDVAIVTDAMTDKSKVFITAQSSTSGKSLFVSYLEPGLGFIVSLDQAIDKDVKFNWFLVDQSN